MYTLHSYVCRLIMQLLIMIVPSVVVVLVVAVLTSSDAGVLVVAVLTSSDTITTSIVLMLTLPIPMHWSYINYIISSRKIVKDNRAVIYCCI